MSLRLLFSAPRSDWEDYREVLPAALAEAGIDAVLEHALDPADPAGIDYIVYAPSSRLTDFTPFAGAKAVLCLWAGVEKIVGNATLTQPLVRMVEPGLREGMVEWVAGHVLRHHLGTDRHVRRRAPHWDVAVPPLARDRTVAILGLGELGAACATALAALGFRVLGWARSPKALAGVETCSGADGFAAVLARAEILVLLLPLTAETSNVFDARAFAALRPGAALLNPGRGGLIDDAALLAALETGQVGHATLDVFREEPLPAEHPFWGHPGVTVTPHVASATRPPSASRAVAENIRRGEAGLPFIGRVDRVAGY